MNERIKELRKQVKIDIHLHNIEDIKAMEGCFGFEGGNKIVNDYIEKFAELIVGECMEIADTHQNRGDALSSPLIDDMIAKHFGVEK
jgi:hypothetical protein